MQPEQVEQPDTARADCGPLGCLLAKCIRVARNLDIRRYAPLALTVMAAALLIAWGIRSDLSKSDWASWVQAIGSIAAIAGAFWLVERQTFAARKLEAEKRHLDNLLRTEIIHTFFSESLFLCEQLQGLDEAHNPKPAVWRHVHKLGEMADAFRGLPAFELPGRGVAFGVLEAPKALTDLRMAAQACLDGWGKLSVHPTATLPSRAVLEFQRAQVHAEGICRAGVASCQEQIQKLRQLTPVDD